MSHTEQEEIKKLNNVKEKIAAEIDIMNSELIGKQDEIVDMKKYFWENCNEFDEFGYEHFTNRQMIQNEIDMAADKMHKRQTYEKLLKSPYFACVDFKYEGDDEDDSYYIGLGSFTPRNSFMPLVFDWRAPIAGLFYDYDKGPASFVSPQGVNSGEITHKLQYSIVNGEIEYFFENDMKIDDDILMRELGTNANARLKTIVATIQREQNAVIRNEKDKILVVQGAAGSGKTSVAMHRIAYLLYHKRKDLNSGNVMILTPNPIFSDYISGILPELGEESIVEMSFDEYAERELADIATFEDRFSQMEFLLNEPKDSEIKAQKERIIAYKQSEEFVNEIFGFVLDLESDILEHKSIIYRGIAYTAEEIEDFFFNRFPDIPVLSRMNTIADYVLTETESREGKDMDPIRGELITERFNAMYRTRDVRKLYMEFLESLDERGIDVNLDEIRASENLPYEDVFPMLLLKLLLFGNIGHREIKHLIVDEMQDYTRVQYVILENLFNCTMTILGDRQQVSSLENAKVLEILPKVFGKGIKLIELKKSYRSTAEIGHFSANIIKDDSTEFFDRHGAMPEILEQPGFEATVKEIADRIQKQTENYSTIAVICKTQANAEKYCEELNKYLPATLFDKETDTFKTGVVVTPFYLAKGLEFDAVHITDADENTYSTDNDRQILYIACTRALHELTLYYSGKKTPLL